MIVKYCSFLTDPSGTSGSMAATSTMGGQGGGAILQCTDDRSTGLAAWQMGGPHNQTLAAPTLWQYPGKWIIECGIVVHLFFLTVFIVVFLSSFSTLVCTYY